MPSFLQRITDYVQRHYDVDISAYSMLLFLTEPSSGKWAYRWNLFLATVVMLRIIAILLESCDGPNNYNNVPDMALYPFLLNRQQYWEMEIACFAPIMLDSLMRIMTLLSVFCGTENEDLAHEMLDEKLMLFSMFGDVVCIVPFLLRASSGNAVTEPFSNSDQLRRVLLRLVELLSISRIIRLVKDIPAVKAIRIALGRAIYDLMVPIFFFFCFNVFFAVIIYFIEPCYDVNTCAWVDLFDATFFSIVTMSTTGYGNQVPYYVLTRLASCIIMVFGALFMSMPLAILGNEYEKAWNEVKGVESSSDPLDKSRGRLFSFGSRKSVSELSKALDNEQRATDSAKPGLGRASPMSEIASHLFSRKLSKDGTASVSSVAPAPPVGLSTLPQATRRRSVVLAAPHPSAVSPSPAKSNAGATVTPPDSPGKNSALQVLGGHRQTQRGDGAIRTDVLDEETERFATEFAAEELVVHITKMKSMAQAISADVNKKEKIRPNILVNICNLRGVLVSTLSLIRTTITSVLRLSGQLSEGRTRKRRGVAVESKRTVALAGNNSVGGSFPNAITKPSQLVSPKDNVSASDEVTAFDNADDREKEVDSVNSDSTGSDTDGETADDALNKSTVESLSEPRSVERTATVLPSPAPPRLSLVNRSGASSGSSLERSTSFIDRGISMVFNNQIRSLADEIQKNNGQNRSIIMMLSNAREDIIGKGAKNLDFRKKMIRAARNPNSFQSKVWMLLELPHSSNYALALRSFLVVLIFLSVATLYSQTLTSLSTFGEQSKVCREVSELYCEDKFDASMDPGCFTYANRTVRLRFYCDDDDADLSACFGHGMNFGAGWKSTNMTCDDSVSGHIPPFQYQDSLNRRYGNPTSAQNRVVSQRVFAPCNRIECSTTYAGSNVNGNAIWLPLELFINSVFLIELVLRAIVTDNWWDFFTDILNVFDILALLPFFIEISMQESIDFSILPSGPDPLFILSSKALKIARLFKITRHYRSTKVLISTAKQIWKQVLAMVCFLIFITTVFAILLYEVEKGDSCYVGEPGCNVPEDALPSLRPDAYVSINKAGDISKFPNALTGLWFSMVSLTSTGYGDMVPETNIGNFMAVLIMLFGSLYMAMPLTAASTAFYQIHQHYDDQMNKSSAIVAPLVVNGAALTAIANNSRSKSGTSDDRTSTTSDIEAHARDRQLGVPVFARSSPPKAASPPNLDDASRCALEDAMSSIQDAVVLIDAYLVSISDASLRDNADSLVVISDKVHVLFPNAMSSAGRLLALQVQWTNYLRSRQHAQDLQ